MFKKSFLAVFVLSFLLFGAGCVQFSGQGRGVMGMFRSSDKGESWVSVSAYPTAQGVKSLAGLKVYQVVRDPSDPAALYLGTRGQGLYYTYDNGDTWRTVPQMEGKFIYGLTVNPNNKCNVFVSDGQHIYRTNDCLRTWKLVFTEERPDNRFVDLAVDYGDDTMIYGAQLNGDILRSLDGGESWKIIKRFTFDVRNLKADPFQPERIFVASYKNGLFVSEDAGENWADLSEKFDDYSESKTFYRLVLNPSKKDSLFWVSKYGILRTDNVGKDWEEIKLLTPPGSVNIYSFAVNPQNEKEIYYTGTVLNDKNQNLRSTFYKSEDGGVNWVTKKLPTNTIPVNLSVHPENNNTLFMGFAILDD